MQAVDVVTRRRLVGRQAGVEGDFGSVEMGSTGPLWLNQLGRSMAEGLDFGVR